jgi:hypothetical protein
MKCWMSVASGPPYSVCRPVKRRSAGEGCQKIHHRALKYGVFLAGMLAVT